MKVTVIQTSSSMASLAVVPENEDERKEVSSLSRSVDGLVCQGALAESGAVFFDLLLMDDGK
jgi:hypothetical protein